MQDAREVLPEVDALAPAGVRRWAVADRGCDRLAVELQLRIVEGDRGGAATPMHFLSAVDSTLALAQLSAGTSSSMPALRSRSKQHDTSPRCPAHSDLAGNTSTRSVSETKVSAPARAPPPITYHRPLTTADAKPWRGGADWPARSTWRSRGRKPHARRRCGQARVTRRPCRGCVRQARRP
jgi:hypothetical protein